MTLGIPKLATNLRASGWEPWARRLGAYLAEQGLNSDRVHAGLVLSFRVQPRAECDGG